MIQKAFFAVFFFSLSNLWAAVEPVSIPGLDQLNIAYRAEKRTFTQRELIDKDGAPIELHATDTYVLDIEFSKLTEPQFQQLTQLFSTKDLQYKTGSVYKLEQFLPPFIQATKNLQFKPIEEEYAWPDFTQNVPPEYEGGVEMDDLYKFADQESALSSYINCWTTAYEFLRTWSTGDLNFDVTWLSRPDATSSLTSEYTDEVDSKDPLVFGDLLIFSSYDIGAGENLVQHAAVHIIPGLYFEKTDTSQDNSIRFVLEADLKAKYKELLPGAKIAYYRLKKDVVLPRLAETINLEATDSELYKNWFSEEDMKSITFVVDWLRLGFSEVSKPVFFPMRLQAISIVPSKEGYVLDDKNPLKENFLQPAFD